MSQGEPERADFRTSAVALATAVGVVGLVLAPLWVGFEPTGGDPDRVFRPLMTELARALRAGGLPFWSDRFGLGLPIVAESEAGAFYPPNHLLYRVLTVSWAYRVSMWLHYSALAATTFAYARRLKVGPWGAAVAAVAFTLCGFQAIHSSHPWAYQALVYLPLALLFADRYAESGRLDALGALIFVLGVQWTIGHFQLQAWTGVLAFTLGTLRIIAERRPLVRVGLLAGAVAAGAGIAAVQLGPSWELATLSGHTARGFNDLAYYGFPLTHLSEPALPRAFRDLPGGHEDPYWFGRLTTGTEAAFHIGTVPLILGIVGLLGAGRSWNGWRAVIVVSLLLATMPTWAPGVFAGLIRLPILGHFRCPARYTVLASLGLCLLAGAGVDLVTERCRARRGLAAALLVGIRAC